MLAIHSMQLKEEVKSDLKNSPAIKKCVALKEGHCEKRCDIQGGGQEMSVMVG